MQSTGFLSKFRWRSQWTRIWLLLFLLPVLSPTYAQQSPDACKLLQPSEIESALGGKAGKFAHMGNADILCSGQIGSLKVLIRISESKGDLAGEKEKKGIDLARAQGMQIDVKTEGDLTCSTLIPPPSLASLGLNTTCSIVRAGRIVAVEVTANSQKEMVSMDVVRKLVQKAFERL